MAALDISRAVARFGTRARDLRRRVALSRAAAPGTGHREACRSPLARRQRGSSIDKMGW